MERKRRRQSGTSFSDTDSVHDVQRRQGHPAPVMPPLFDKHADLLLDVALHSNKSLPMYIRSIGELVGICKRSATQMTIPLLHEWIRSRAEDGVSIDQVLDILEPIVAIELAKALLDFTLRPRTIVSTMHAMMAVGEAKYGRKFSDSLHSDLEARTRPPRHKPPDNPVHDHTSTLTACGSEGSVPCDVPESHAAVGSRPPSAPRAMQAQMTSVGSPACRSTGPRVSSANEYPTNTSPTTTSPTNTSPTATSIEPREDHGLSKYVYVRMRQCPSMTIDHQKLAIIIACKKHLGQGCGVQRCELRGSSFVLIFATGKQAQKAVGERVFVDGADVLLMQYRPRGISYQSGAGRSSDAFFGCIFSTTVPEDIAVDAESRAIECVAKAFLDQKINFSLQRQVSAQRTRSKYWILSFDRAPRLEKSYFLVEFVCVKPPRPQCLTFEPVSPLARCCVCNDSHLPIKCRHVTTFEHALGRGLLLNTPLYNRGASTG